MTSKARKLSPNQATVIETLRRGGSLTVFIDFRIPKRVKLRDAKGVPVAGIRAASVGSLFRAGLIIRTSDADGRRSYRLSEAGESR